MNRVLNWTEDLKMEQDDYKMESCRSATRSTMSSASASCSWPCILGTAPLLGAFIFITAAYHIKLGSVSKQLGCKRRRSHLPRSPQQGRRAARLRHARGTLWQYQERQQSYTTPDSGSRARLGTGRAAGEAKVAEPISKSPRVKHV